jgi:hypothetical protein
MFFKKPGIANTPFRPSGGLSDGAQSFMVFGAFTFLRRVFGFVRSDPFGEGVAMDAEHGGGIGKVLLVTRERLLYIELFEFFDGLFQQDVAFEHFVNEIFETVVNQSSFPVSSL